MEIKMKNKQNNSLSRCRALSNVLVTLASVIVINSFSISTALAEENSESEITQEQIIKYNEISASAKQNKVQQAAKGDATGNDPRVFSNKFMPFYRSTELENGMIQQLTKLHLPVNIQQQWIY